MKFSMFSQPPMFTPLRRIAAPLPSTMSLPRVCSVMRRRRLDADRLEDHDGDLAVGLGLEIAVGRPGRVHAPPQLGPLSGGGTPPPTGVVVGLALPGHGRVRLQVEEPARRVAAAV